MESGFGYDFSRVRVHHDAAAAHSARELRANCARKPGPQEITLPSAPDIGDRRPRRDATCWRTN
ncbi:MAG: eCIS core domain-containing protein [Methylococcales bacterium]